MRGRPFFRSFFRSIFKKPGRFLALLAIVALGAGFYAGLRMTAPDMDRFIDDYLDSARAYDVRVVSTLGLTQADLDALANLEEVAAVEGAYEADVQATLNGDDYTMRFHSLPGMAEEQLDDAQSDAEADAEADAQADASPNQLALVEGRWPETPSECVICADCILDEPYGVGDVVEVQPAAGEGSPLGESRFEVVGLVRSPLYVSPVSLGASAVGSGSLDEYAYVVDEVFTQRDAFSEAFVTVTGASAERYDTDAYWEKVDAARAAIDAVAPKREQARLDDIRDQAEAELQENLREQGLPEFLVEATMQSAEVQKSLEDELPSTCEWLVLERTKNVGIQSYASDAERVDHIASIFPLVFLLVAALVALTTMTRMVDEDRILIGTFKALGYSRARITLRYVGYALLASGIGGVIGIAILSQVLPAVITNAYTIMYTVPSSDFRIDAPLALLAWSLAVGVTLLATWASVANTLRERPARLMLPPAPKAGKRILVERIRPLWARLSFSWKVTLRNLFRYKKRAIMTLIGIAGCTALLLTGLGLHNAINDIIDIHFYDIVHYNAIISVDEEAADEQARASVEEVLDDPNLASNYVRVRTETRLAPHPEGDEPDPRVELMVPESPERFSELMTLRDRLTHDGLALEEGSAIVSEKLARSLGVGVGDTIELAEQDSMGNAASQSIEVEIGGLSETYVGNYVYVTPSTFEQAMGEQPAYTRYYVQATEDEGLRQQLAERLSAIGAVGTISFNDETIETYRTMLRSVDLIVVVLAVSAALLAFIVLYNLTNINIEERVREIATLKVLGFTKRETNAYIFREVLLLAIVGCLIGLLLGIPLEGYVVDTAEVDAVMFGRSIHAGSFVAAFVLTIAFTLATLFMMLPKLSGINMVESLKSNE